MASSAQALACKSRFIARKGTGSANSVCMHEVPGSQGTDQCCKGRKKAQGEILEVHLEYEIWLKDNTGEGDQGLGLEPGVLLD